LLYAAYANCAYQRGDLEGAEQWPSDDALVGGILQAEFHHHIRSLMEGLSKSGKKGGKGARRHGGRRGRRR